MSLPDLSNLSSSELTEVINTATNLTEKKKADELAAFQAEVQAMAAERGLSMDDVCGNKKAAAGKRAKVAPKYQNPDDASITWTGRGRQPKWFEAAIEAGKSRADLEI